jgi:DMSO/TMAO reductase YedYZ molybdopterin-dependent catalytic subunit
MRRREFILGAIGALGVSALRLEADHHAISADPLVVEFDLGSLEGRYTRVEDFYVRNHFEVPKFAGSSSLHIDGQVEQRLELSFSGLRRLARHTNGAVLECAGAPVSSITLVSDGIWGGWLLDDVVSLARPRRSGAYLHCFGRDGFARSLPIDDALRCGLLVTTLDGRPLTRNHGAPWRVLFPGWYGMNSVKWLERITVAEAPLQTIDNAYVELWARPAGRIERRPLPHIQVKSIITDPVNNSVLRRGQVLVRGLAWSGTGSISAVQVSTDAGIRWIAAKLDRSDSRFDWTLWRAVVELNGPGLIELVSRAVDQEGNMQPATRDQQRIDIYAGNAYHRIRCVVVGG